MQIVPSKFKPKVFPLANIVTVAEAVTKIRYEMRENPFTTNHLCLITQVAQQLGIQVPNCKNKVEKEYITCKSCDKLIDSWYNSKPAICGSCDKELDRYSNHLAHYNCICKTCEPFYRNFYILPGFYEFLICLRKLKIIMVKDVLKIIFDLTKFDHIVLKSNGNNNKYNQLVHFSKINQDELYKLFKIYPEVRCPNEFIQCKATLEQKSEKCTMYIPYKTHSYSMYSVCPCKMYTIKLSQHIQSCPKNIMDGFCNNCQDHNKCKYADTDKNCQGFKTIKNLGLCLNCCKTIKCITCPQKRLIDKKDERNNFACKLCKEKGICCYACKKIYKKDSPLFFGYVNGLPTDNIHSPYQCTFCVYTIIKRKPDYCGGIYTAFLTLHFSRKYIHNLNEYIMKYMKCEYTNIFEKIMFRLSVERGDNKKGYYRDLQYNMIGKNKEQLLDYYNSLSDFSDIDWYLSVLRLPVNPFNIIMNYLLRSIK